MASTTPTQIEMATLDLPTTSASSIIFIPRKEVASSEEHHLATHIRLSAADREIVLHSLGAVSLDERHSLAQPESIIYPPRGLPIGLYRDIIRSRVISQYKYYSICLLFNITLLLQLILCAIMTAQSSMGTWKNARMTAIAATNTINAGLIGLIHHSGLPERYKNDWKRFENVEMHVKELIEGGFIKERVSRDQAIETCFSMYRKAKEAVAKNKPAVYAASNVPASESTERLV